MKEREARRGTGFKRNPHQMTPRRRSKQQRTMSGEGGNNPHFSAVWALS